MMTMKPKAIEEVLEPAKTWPEVARADLAQAALGIEADIERGVYDETCADRCADGRLGENVRVVTLTRYPYRIFYRLAPNAVELLHIRYTLQTPWEGAPLIPPYSAAAMPSRAPPARRVSRWRFSGATRIRKWVTPSPRSERSTTSQFS
jgi:hypothetical protein